MAKMYYGLSQLMGDIEYLRSKGVGNSDARELIKRLLFFTMPSLSVKEELGYKEIAQSEEIGR